MKNIALIATLVVAGFSSMSYARDDIGNYSIKEALATPQAKTKLGTEVSFYFSNQPHGKALKDFGVFKTNKKTNAFNKTDKEACQWAFLSAMLALKARALQEGGNAVIEIQSNYKNKLTSSRETFQCGAGALMAGVALKGRVVTLK